MLPAGQYDRRIVVERATETPASGGNGEPIKTWAALSAAGIWARFEATGGRERAEEGQERVAFEEATFAVRYRSDWQPRTKDRVLYRGRYFDVLAVNEVKRLDELHLICQARAE